MDLLDALQRAVTFAGKDGYVLVEPAVFDEAREIVLLDDRVPVPHVPAAVSAHDGETGIRILLGPDADVPLVGLHAGALRKALVSTRGAFTLGVQGATAVLVPVAGGRALTVPAHAAPAQLRPAMAFPDTMRPLAASSVASMARVAHATVDDPDRPLLRHVRLGHRGAEATDQTRIAQATHPRVVDRGVLVAPHVFRKLKGAHALGGLAWVAQTDGWWWLALGEELRWSRALPDTGFFNLDALVDMGPCFHAGVNGQLLASALLAASKTSPVGVAELVLGQGACEVSGVTAAGIPTSKDRLLAVGNTPEVVRVVFRAKYLQEAVASAADPLGRDQVELRYRSALAPVQVRRGNYVETVWPLAPPEVEDAKNP